MDLKLYTVGKTASMMPPCVAGLTYHGGIGWHNAVACAPAAWQHQQPNKTQVINTQWKYNGIRTFKCFFMPLSFHYFCNGGRR